MAIEIDHRRVEKMDQDPKILSRIGDLVDEEHALRSRHRETPLTGSELGRLEEIEIQLDQCWDLLNQRRALTEFDMEPDQARSRPSGTVEGYQQ
jgi:Protein of unknown function (DUF2630)